VPRNGIKARLHHPMVLGVKVWAFAHLLANGNLADVVLFGSFLLWAALSFRAARGRDRAAGTVYAARHRQRHGHHPRRRHRGLGGVHALAACAADRRAAVWRLTRHS
jgi:hypothetical protein